MRRALALAHVPQPDFAVTHDPELLPSIPFPVVVKPVGLSASRGVMRADDAEAALAATRRVRAICDGPIIVEEYVPGDEVAVEGLLRDGELEVLAIFDKPDPLVGPYFEETIYVTPSRLPSGTQARVGDLVARAAAALGLTEGPVHAELRIDGSRIWVIEIAARSIGGLCARALRFGAGISLEEVILRHALRQPLDGIAREDAASGVMMLPIAHAGVLQEVRGQGGARAVPGITGLEITVPKGRRVLPLPEGDRYLGFLFARAETPEAVEHALRTAHAKLDVVIQP
jgi:biotin carboxylase